MDGLLVNMSETEKGRDGKQDGAREEMSELSVWR